MSATSTSKEHPLHDYTPLIVDATNISKSKVPYKSGVCSVVDSIIGGRSEGVEMVYERDSNILGRKRRRAVGESPQTARLKVSDVPSACKYKKKCVKREEDAPSVISLGSDDEIEVLDSDTKPELDGRRTGVHLSDMLRDRQKSDILVIDLCTPSKNSKPTILTRKNTDHKDKKMSSDSRHKCCKTAFKQYESVLGIEVRTSHNRGHDVPLACPVSARPASDATVKSGVEKTQNREVSYKSGVEKTQNCEVSYKSGVEKTQNREVSCKSGVEKTQNREVSCKSGVEKAQDCEVSFKSSRQGCNLMYWNCNDVRQSLQAVDNQAPSSSVRDNNLYNPHPDTVRTGLRPIVIDGSNVAMGHGNGRVFSCRGLQICIDYFLQRKHRVVAFVPQFRKGSILTQDTAILDHLEKQGLVSFTPSRRIGNQLVIPYDDRYTVQYAAECGGVIVSTDQFRDLVNENPAWRETIENRLLMFTWVGDVLMFPQDPLGRHGPTLESFLRFP